MASIDPAGCVPVSPKMGVPFRDCAHCDVRKANRCALLPPAEAGKCMRFDGTQIAVRARHTISDPLLGDGSRVIVVCAGLAFRSRIMRSGRRQILNYLMPGDIVATHDIFGADRTATACAVTDVRCATFDRKAVMGHLASRPDLMFRLARSCASETAQMEDLLMDLGRCTGIERVARFFIGYARRIHARGWDRQRPIPFPIRQVVLADTLGLTTTHVGRIIGQLRGERIVEIGGGWMSLLDPGRLALLADLRIGDWTPPVPATIPDRKRKSA